LIYLIHKNVENKGQTRGHREISWKFLQTTR
jgi:hypothetical protein